MLMKRVPNVILNHGEIKARWKRLHRLEVEEAQEEEMELRERNAMVQLEEKMMDGRNPDTKCPDGKRRAGRVEEKALAVVREAVVEQRSKADREDDEIARKVFVVVKPLYEQSPQNDFSCEVPGASKQRAGKTPLASSLVRKIVPEPFLGLNYGSDSD
jgi:hypothetical protein